MRPPRRSVLAAATAGLAGCAGRQSVSCASSPTVLDLVTRVVRVVMPNEFRGEATLLTDSFIADGYVARVNSVSVADRTDDRAELTVIGNVSRETVVSRVENAGISEYTVTVEQVDGSAIGRISGEPKYPWDDPLLTRRNAYLTATGPKLGVSLPSITATQLRVGIGTRETDAVQLVRSLFRPGGLFSVSLVGPDDEPTPPSFVSRAEPNRLLDPDSLTFRQRNGSVTVRARTIPASLYPSLVFDPTRTARDLPPADEARLVFRLDGRRLTSRSLTERERRYRRWYADHPGDDPPDSFDTLPVSVPGLSPTAALRLAASVHAPTGTPNAFERRC